MDEPSTVVTILPKCLHGEAALAQGHRVRRKRVRRLMQTMGLEAVYQRTVPLCHASKFGLSYLAFPPSSHRLPN